MGAGIPASAVTINLDCGGKSDVARRNDAGWLFSATEVRNLCAYDGKLFVGVGLWTDTPPPGDTPNPGCAIMRLDNGNSELVIEHSFRGADTAVCLLYSAWFASAKQTVFVASTWNSRYSDLYVRDYGSSSWHFAQCINEKAPGGETNQIRSAITYTDPVTGVSRLFLGQSPRGVFSLEYDADARGGLGQATLEFDMTGLVSTAGTGEARVMSFAILGGNLYCTVFNGLYQRENGDNPCWRLVYVDDDVGASESGFRGLTAVGNETPNPYFFVAREGSKAAILKLVPPEGEAAWAQTVEYDMVKELSEAWTNLYGGEVKAGYGVAAYNHMTWFQPHGAEGPWALFVGFESFVNKHPPALPTIEMDGDALHAAGCYLVWNFEGRSEWRLNHLPAVTSQPMVACRVGAVNPFGGTRFYIGGYDCNREPSHLSGYLVSLDMARMLDGAVA